MAHEVGFDDCGIAQAEAIPQFSHSLQEWTAQGCHASMSFMEQHQEMRGNPQLLVPDAKSVISLVVGYKPSQTMQGPFRIAQYAYGEDYHEKIKRMLFALIARIQERYPDFEAKPCVDTVPISDKLWAMKAGLGWIGKNTLFVHPRLGSFCNLGELVTAAEMDSYDSPIPNQCGECHKCVDACPNRALKIDSNNKSMLDARRCTSYHTIENRSEQLPESLRTNGYVFGCDCCQLVCPFNQQAPVSVEVPSERLQELETLPQADEPTFKQLTRHSPISRIKYYQWHRNLEKVPKSAL